MKNLKIAFLSLSLLATSIAFTACGSGNAAADKQGKEYTSEYVCPMHCEGSGSEKEGKCPVCGMAYVKNKDHKADGHKHDDHSGHNH